MGKGARTEQVVREIHRRTRRRFPRECSPSEQCARSRTYGGDAFWSRFLAAPARLRGSRREHVKLVAVGTHGSADVWSLSKSAHRHGVC
jgi:hypothetical protein